MNYRKWYLQIFIGIWIDLMGFLSICNGVVVLYANGRRMNDKMIPLVFILILIGILYLVFGSLLISKPSHYGKIRNRTILSTFILILCVSEIIFHFFDLKIGLFDFYPALLPIILIPITFLLKHNQDAALYQYRTSSSPKTYSNPYIDPEKVLSDFQDPLERLNVFQKLYSNNLITESQFEIYKTRIHEKKGKS